MTDLEHQFIRIGRMIFIEGFIFGLVFCFALLAVTQVDPVYGFLLGGPIGSLSYLVFRYYGKRIENTLANLTK